MATTEALALAAALALIGGVADARWPADKPHTPEASWFQSLKQPNGGSCCDLSDCFRLDDSMVRQIGDHYQFRADAVVFKGLGDGQWHDIPDEVLIRGQKLAALGGNPTGQWIVCAMRGGYMSTGSIMVLCAVPPGAV